MTKAINVRLDAEAHRALKTIQSLDGLSTSEAVRKALLDAEQQHFTDEAIREAWIRISEDPNERAEAEELDRIFGDPWEDLPL